MKRKNDQPEISNWVGADGEFLVSLPIKPKRGSQVWDDGSPETTAQVNQLILGLFLLGLILGLGVVAWMLLDVEKEQPSISQLPTLAVPNTLAPLSPPNLMISPIPQNPLPPTWTPSPTVSAPSPQTLTTATHTPKPTITPSATPDSDLIQREIRGWAEWQGMGITVQAGDYLQIEYSGGQWSPWENGGWYEGNGLNGYPCDLETCIIPLYPFAGLVGRIGAEENRPFKVGNYTSFLVTVEGELFLRMNDPVTGDNDGSIWVNIQVTRQN